MPVATVFWDVPTLSGIFKVSFNSHTCCLENRKFLLVGIHPYSQVGIGQIFKTNILPVNSSGRQAP